MKYHKIILFLILGAVIVSCKTGKTVSGNAESDNSYASGFPDKNIYDQLDKVSKTIKRIECLTFYKSYVLSENNPLKKGMSTKENLKKYAVADEITHASVSGTATIIYYNGERVGILTCAHVVDFADTLYNWEDEEQTKLYSVAIKLRQKIYVSGLPSGGDIKIVAMDKKNDIVLLKKELDPQHEKPQVFNIQRGKPEDLEWGTLVYIMGYPTGELMITRAIVSNPGKIKRGTFLTDAVYNRGISGAPVFAYRKNTKDFEWVGMAKSSSVDKFYYLKPDKEHEDAGSTGQLYTGSEYVGQYTRIKYGVAHSITVDAIVKFLKSHRQELEKEGIDLQTLN
jgi:S1-C subfamily serine protease